MRGFTLVELIIVVLVIAVLTAIALPRFMDATDQARLNSAQSVTSSFQQSVAQLHGQWQAEGEPTSILLCSTGAVALILLRRRRRTLLDRHA